MTEKNRKLYDMIKENQSLDTIKKELQLTEKQLEKMQIKSTFIIVWKAMAHQIKQMENKEENIETKNDKIDGLNQKERDDGDEER